MHRNVGLTLLGLALLPICACAPSRSNDAESRVLVQRFVEAANAHRYDELDDLLTAGFTRHSESTPDVEVRSREDMKAFLEKDAAAFPDGRVTIESMTVEGDRVAFQATYSGTQTGPMGPYPPTNQHMTIAVSGVFRIDGARIAELWILWDNLAALGQLGHWPPAGGAPGLDMDAKKALARVWFEDVINRRDLDAIDQHYAPDYVHHGPEGAELRGVQAARDFAAAILAASSDRVAVVEQQVAQGDLVVTRFTSRGTQTGPFRGVAPTGEEWVTEGICISRIEDGKIAEDWEIVHISGI